jgi:hypothetical protein
VMELEPARRGESSPPGRLEEVASTRASGAERQSGRQREESTMVRAASRRQVLAAACARRCHSGVGRNDGKKI